VPSELFDCAKTSEVVTDAFDLPGKANKTMSEILDLK
jgi:hypothetical protein